MERLSTVSCIVFCSTVDCHLRNAMSLNVNVNSVLNGATENHRLPKNRRRRSRPREETSRQARGTSECPSQPSFLHLPLLRKSQLPVHAGKPRNTSDR